MNYQRNAPSSNGHRESQQLERDIERTRGAIDRTLDEIGDRLHPQHLLHQVLDLFRSSDDEPNEWAIEMRRSSKRMMRKIKRNPLPAVLIGAGAAWLWMQDDKEQRRRELHRQWDDLPEHSGSSVDARTGEPYGETDPYEDYPTHVNISPAWHSRYDWADAHDDEKSWMQRAESTLSELQTAVGDSMRPLKERLGLVAGKMVSLSGLKRSEIQRALRAQWDGTPSHSGSFVDARTGQPYDDSYGEQWRQLASLDALSSADFSDEDESWQTRAEQTLQSIQEKLADQSLSAKDRLSAIGTQLSTLAESSRGFATKYGQKGRRKMRSVARSAQQGAQRVGHQVGAGYESTRDYLAETMEEKPLPIGIGVLGLGLLIGAMLPATRREDEAMGESADAIKSRGAAAGREAMEQGQQMARSAGEAALDEARRQGLTPSQLAEKAQQGAERVAQQAQQGAQRVAETVKQQLPSGDDLRSRAQAVAHQAKDAANEQMRDQHSTSPSASSASQPASSASQSASSDSRPAPIASQPASSASRPAPPAP